MPREESKSRTGTTGSVFSALRSTARLRPVARNRKRRGAKAGLPPGTLVHVGEPRAGSVEITIFDYDASNVHEEHLAELRACAEHRGTPGVTWINVDGVHDTAIVQRLGEAYGIHPLVLEDIVNTDQRPKVEPGEGYVHAVVKMLSCRGEQHEIVAEQVSFVLGEGFLLTFQEEPQHDVFEPVRERIRKNQGSIRQRGADYLCYRLIDAIVDNYFVVMERIGERIETLEEEVVDDPTPKTLRGLHEIKRKLTNLRRSVWPLREAIGSLTHGESALVRSETLMYFRDIYDHTIQVIDTLETYRDLVADMLDLYLSSQSNRMNEIMKILTVITTIFIPLSFIAGIYGMNFHYMPELASRWGYPIALGSMLAIGLAMVAWFKRKGWM